MTGGTFAKASFLHGDLAFCWAALLCFPSKRLSAIPDQLLESLKEILQHRSSGQAELQLVIDLRSINVDWENDKVPDSYRAVFSKFAKVWVIREKESDTTFKTDHWSGVQMRTDEVQCPTYWLISPGDSTGTSNLIIHQFGQNLIALDNASASNSAFARGSKKLIERCTKLLAEKCWLPAEGGNVRLRSTPLTGPGVFDARLVLGNPSAYAWLCFLLALRVMVSVEPTKDSSSNVAGLSQTHQSPNRPVRILACTQNGVAISAGVLHAYDLLNPQNKIMEIEGIDVIDRYGPPQRYIEEYSFSISNQISGYIYIGDFVIAGTELKLAQAHSFHRGTTILKAVVIGSLLDPEKTNIFSNDFCVDALVSLSDLELRDRAKNSVSLKYTFGDGSPNPDGDS